MAPTWAGPGLFTYGSPLLQKVVCKHFSQKYRSHVVWPKSLFQLACINVALLTVCHETIFKKTAEYFSINAILFLIFRNENNLFRETKMKIYFLTQYYCNFLLRNPVPNALNKNTDNVQLSLSIAKG